MVDLQETAPPRLKRPREDAQPVVDAGFAAGFEGRAEGVSVDEGSVVAVSRLSPHRRMLAEAAQFQHVGTGGVIFSTSVRVDMKHDGSMGMRVACNDPERGPPCRKHRSLEVDMEVFGPRASASVRLPVAYQKLTPPRVAVATYTDSVFLS